MGIYDEIQKPSFRNNTNTFFNLIKASLTEKEINAHLSIFHTTLKTLSVPAVLFYMICLKNTFLKKTIKVICPIIY